MQTGSGSEPITVVHTHSHLDYHHHHHNHPHLGEGVGVGSGGHISPGDNEQLLLSHHHLDHANNLQSTLEALIEMKLGLGSGHGLGLGLGHSSQPNSRGHSRRPSANGPKFLSPISPLNSARGGYNSALGSKILSPISPLNSARGGYNSARDRGVPPVFVSSLSGHIRYAPDITPRQEHEALRDNLNHRGATGTGTGTWGIFGGTGGEGGMMHSPDNDETQSHQSHQSHRSQKSLNNADKMSEVSQGKVPLTNMVWERRGRGLAIESTLSNLPYLTCRI